MKNWLIALVVVVLAAAGWWYFMARPPEAEPEAPPPPAMPREEPSAPPMPATEEPFQAEEPSTASMGEPAAEEAPLPDLAESDPLAVDTLATLVGDAAVEKYWDHEAVISRLVATVDALEGQQVPGVIQAVHGPQSGFDAKPVDKPETVIRNEQGDPVPQFVVDPANYARYEPYVKMLEAVDADQAVALYHQYRPLFQQAYRQLGYEQGTFDDRLLDIIDELLATPDVPDPIRLVKPEAYYKFADPDLEALNAGQKILVRMGSANAAQVKSKLVQIRDALRMGE